MEVIMDCCSKEKKETLCELAKNKNIEELKKLAKNAKYICPGCYRVANDPKRICCKPEKLDD
jgi:hypothetical protein